MGILEDSHQVETLHFRKTICVALRRDWIWPGRERGVETQAPQMGVKVALSSVVAMDGQTEESTSPQKVRKGPGADVRAKYKSLFAFFLCTQMGRLVLPLGETGQIEGLRSDEDETLESCLCAENRPAQQMCWQ